MMLARRIQALCLSYWEWKKIKCKKRHILVDTTGLVIHALVHAANIQDRDGGVLVMATLFGLSSWTSGAPDAMRNISPRP